MSLDLSIGTENQEYAFSPYIVPAVRDYKNLAVLPSDSIVAETLLSHLFCRAVTVYINPSQ